MVTWLVVLALAGPGDLRPARAEGLELLGRGEVPTMIAPQRATLGRRFVDEAGRLYAREEVYELLDAWDPEPMQVFWRQRWHAHRWSTAMVVIPPPWGFGALAAHLQWRRRAGRTLEQVLVSYNAGAGAGDLP